MKKLFLFILLTCELSALAGGGTPLPNRSHDKEAAPIVRGRGRGHFLFDDVTLSRLLSETNAGRIQSEIQGEVAPFVISHDNLDDSEYEEKGIKLDTAKIQGGTLGANSSEDFQSFSSSEESEDEEEDESESSEQAQVDAIPIRIPSARGKEGAPSVTSSEESSQEESVDSVASSEGGEDEGDEDFCGDAHVLEEKKQDMQNMPVLAENLRIQTSALQNESVDVESSEDFQSCISEEGEDEKEGVVSVASSEEGEDEGDENFCGDARVVEETKQNIQNMPVLAENLRVQASALQNESVEVESSENFHSFASSEDSEDEEEGESKSFEQAQVDTIPIHTPSAPGKESVPSVTSSEDSEDEKEGVLHVAASQGDEGKGEEDFCGDACVVEEKNQDMQDMPALADNLCIQADVTANENLGVERGEDSQKAASEHKSEHKKEEAGGEVPAQAYIGAVQIRTPSEKSEKNGLNVTSSEKSKDDKEGESNLGLTIVRNGTPRVRSDEDIQRLCGGTAPVSDHGSNDQNCRPFPAATDTAQMQAAEPLPPLASVKKGRKIESPAPKKQEARKSEKVNKTVAQERKKGNPPVKAAFSVPELPARMTRSVARTVSAPKDVAVSSAQKNDPIRCVSEEESVEKKVKTTATNKQKGNFFNATQRKSARLPDPTPSRVTTRSMTRPPQSQKNAEVAPSLKRERLKRSSVKDLFYGETE